MKNYNDALKYLDWLCAFGVKEGLERIKALSFALGHPQNFYRTIHVAGTNGKGSVSAMLAEMLRAQGYRVGLFTSPHLVSYRERIRINGENIPENDFAEMIFRVKDCGIEATHFEVLTAAAFEYFRECAVDYAVIEVGLGGLYDSTNIIKPELAIITNVALDHENILGDLEGIARNKAGIIKENIPTVTGAVGKPLDIIRAVAKQKNSKLYEVNSPVDTKINLRGEYQRMNAAVAVKAGRVLGIEESKISAALERVEWAGRFEVIEKGAEVFIIDGAHNPDGAKALRASLDKDFPNGKRFWLFGALRDKNFDEMIRILFRADDFVIVTPPQSERAAPTEILCQSLRGQGINCVAEEDNAKAVEKLKDCSGGIKIAAGSLYLIGAVRDRIR